MEGHGLPGQYMCYYVQKPEIILVGQICADFQEIYKKTWGLISDMVPSQLFLCFGSLSYMAAILTGSNEAPKWKYMEKQIFRQK